MHGYMGHGYVQETYFCLCFPRDKQTAFLFPSDD